MSWFLSSSRRVMASHRELETLRRSNKSSRNFTRWGFVSSHCHHDLNGCPNGWWVIKAYISTKSKVFTINLFFLLHWQHECSVLWINCCGSPQIKKGFVYVSNLSINLCVSSVISDIPRDLSAPQGWFYSDKSFQRMESEDKDVGNFYIYNTQLALNIQNIHTEYLTHLWHFRRATCTIFNIKQHASRTGIYASEQEHHSFLKI